MQKRMAVLRSACKVLLNELNLYLAWSVPLRIDKNLTLLCSGVRIFANNTVLGTSHIMIVHNPGELGGVLFRNQGKYLETNKALKHKLQNYRNNFLQ